MREGSSGQIDDQQPPWLPAQLDLGMNEDGLEMGLGPCPARAHDARPLLDLASPPQRRKAPPPAAPEPLHSRSSSTGARSPSAATASPHGAAATLKPRPRSHRASVDRPHRSTPRSASCPCELSWPAPPPPREGGRKPHRRRCPRASPGDAHWQRRGGEEGEGGSSGRRRQEAPVAHGSDAEPRVFSDSLFSKVPMSTILLKSSRLVGNYRFRGEKKHHVSCRSGDGIPYY
jgi:hypothetical protein